MPDVFELTMASGRRTGSIRENSDCLISSRSTTASTIQSHWVIAFRSSSNPPVLMRAWVAGVKKDTYHAST